MQSEFGFSWKISAITILLAWYGFFALQQIDLTTADLGRHIKNGEIVWENLFSGEIAPDRSPLTVNFYSFTSGDYQVINHHWGSGIIFYLIDRYSGLEGLSVAYLALSLLTLLIFFDVARKEGGYSLAFPLGLLLIPLIGERTEIRPEIFSSLFSGIFLWILWNYHRHRLSDYWLLILPLVQILWVNTHIYFFLGPVISGLIIFEALVFCRRENHKLKWLMINFLAVSAATLVNPFGYKALTYAATIFNNYGYRLVENQSVYFLLNYGLRNPNLLLYMISAILLLVSFGLAFWNRNRSHNPVCASCSIFLGTVGLGLGVMAFLAIRNFTLFGFFALPVISYAIYNSFPKKYARDPELVFLIATPMALLILGTLFYFHPQTLPGVKARFGTGTLPNNDLSAEFFLKNGISGPIFNNYDVGSYLIYRLQSEKVFVDNRPEAYPKEFFEQIYIPMQENPQAWKDADRRYGFNAIFFSHRDATPWGQQFLIDRVQDPEWAPVFADDFNIIFLKHNERNAEVISKYEIDRSNFGIIGK